MWRASESFLIGMFVLLPLRAAAVKSAKEMEAENIRAANTDGALLCA